MTQTVQKLYKKNRIAKRADFLRIQASGRKFRSAHLLLVVSEHEGESGGADCRIGVTVTRKIDKRAARRNKLRRRIKELFRKQRTRLRRGADLVFIAQNDACELEYEELAEEFSYLMRKARL